MKLIKSKFEIIEQRAGLEGIYKQIELAGRTCYKSEDKITEDSAKNFVDRMIKLEHGAMLEHGTVYLYFPMLYNDKHLYHRVEEYYRNPYSKVRIAFEENGQPKHNDNGYYITTNLRVLVENNWMDDLQYLCEPTEYHDKRITVRFTCDRGVSHEFVRHRVMSFAQESTRYCNYSKDKFGNEITCIIPSWLDIPEGYYMWEDANPLVTAGMDIQVAGWDDCSNISYKSLDSKAIDVYNEYKSCGSKDFHLLDIFLEGLQKCEDIYFSLLDQGWKPQQARAVLPNALKTELVMTGFISDWKHFFKLRAAESAHPDAQALAKPLYKEFLRREYIKDLY